MTSATAGRRGHETASFGTTQQSYSYVVFEIRAQRVVFRGDDATDPEEAEWDSLMVAYADALDTAAEAALAEHRAGETEDMFPLE